MRSSEACQMAIGAFLRIKIALFQNTKRSFKIKVYKGLISLRVTYDLKPMTASLQKKMMNVRVSRLAGAEAGPSELIEDDDLVRFMKCQRIRWLGHI